MRSAAGEAVRGWATSRQCPVVSVVVSTGLSRVGITGLGLGVVVHGSVAAPRTSMSTVLLYPQPKGLPSALFCPDAPILTIPAYYPLDANLLTASSPPLPCHGCGCKLPRLPSTPRQCGDDRTATPLLSSVPAPDAVRSLRQLSCYHLRIRWAGRLPPPSLRPHLSPAPYGGEERRALLSQLAVSAGPTP